MKSVVGKQVYPAIRIHALGVDENYQLKGKGRGLLYLALDICKEMSESVGVTFATVECFTDSIEFYKKCEFIYLNRINRNLHYMAFKLDELK